MSDQGSKNAWIIAGAIVLAAVVIIAGFALVNRSNRLSDDCKAAVEEHTFREDDDPNDVASILQRLSNPTDPREVVLKLRPECEGHI